MTTKTKKAARKSTTKTAPAKHAAAKTPAKKAERVSMWGAARELIKAGKTNADVLAMLRERFHLPEEHSYYARWYRSFMVKKGLITKAFAKAHAGAPAQVAAKT